MNCYIPSATCSDLPKPRVWTSFARCTRIWDRALNVGVTMATMTALPGITTTSVPEWLAFQKGERATDS
jgi:hypothetical protein